MSQLDSERALPGRTRGFYPFSMLASFLTRPFRVSNYDSIFRQHKENLAKNLLGLQEFTEPVTLAPRQFLYESDGGIIPEEDRGLFFIESGVVVSSFLCIVVWTVSFRLVVECLDCSLQIFLFLTSSLSITDGSATFSVLHPWFARSIQKIERDTSLTAVRSTHRGGGGVGGGGTAHPLDARRLVNDFSLNEMQARLGTIGRKSALLRGSQAGAMVNSSRIRLARIGPGWIIGTEGSSSGGSLHMAVAGKLCLVQTDVGKKPEDECHTPLSIVSSCFIACSSLLHVRAWIVSECRLHLLSYSTIRKIEVSKPDLVLRLYKLLSHLAERRQEITVGQLATLHSILTSPPPRGPRRRIPNVASHTSFFG